MQNLLNIKQKLEDQYQMEYGKAIQQRDRQKKKIAEIREMIKQTNHRFFEKQASPFRVGELKQVQNKISYLKQQETDAKKELEKREQEVICWRERLTKAMQERKTYEVLKEKAYERHLEEEKQMELKRMDEQSSFKFGRKKGHENG